MILQSYSEINKLKFSLSNRDRHKCSTIMLFEFFFQKHQKEKITLSFLQHIYLCLVIYRPNK